MVSNQTECVSNTNLPTVEGRNRKHTEIEKCAFLVGSAGCQIFEGVQSITNINLHVDADGRVGNCIGRRWEVVECEGIICRTGESSTVPESDYSGCIEYLHFGTLGTCDSDWVVGIDDVLGHKLQQYEIRLDTG